MTSRATLGKSRCYFRMLVGALTLMLLAANLAHPLSLALPAMLVHRAPARQPDAQQEALRAELQQYLDALDQARRTSDRANEISALVYIALTYEKLKEHQSAINYYSEALKLLTPRGSRRAAVLYSLGDNYASLRFYPQALTYFKEAIPLWQEEKKSQSEAQTHIEIGDIHRLLGDYGEAMKSFQEARRLYQLVNDPESEAGVLAVLGSVATTHREMLLYYNQSLRIWERLEDHANQATILSGLGSIYSDFDDRESLRYFELARAAWRKASDPVEEAKILMDIGLTHVWLNEKQKALESFAEALNLWRALRNRRGEAETLTRLGWTYNWNGERSKALENLLKAAALLEDEPTKAAVPLGHAAIIYAYFGENRKALETIDRVIKVYRELNSSHPSKPILLYDIGLVHHLTGNRRDAFSYWNQMVDLHRSREDPRGEADALHTIGVAYEFQGDLKTSLSYYLRSLEARDRVRSDAGVEELKIRLAEKSADAYQHAMLLQLRLDQRSLEAFRMSERARARTFLDQLGNVRLGAGPGGDSELIRREQALRKQISELETRFGELQKLVLGDFDEREIQNLSEQLATRRREYERTLTNLKLENPEYASLRSVDVLGVKEVGDLLDKDTTLLSFVVTPEQTIAFVVARDKYEVVTLDVREQELFDAVSEVRAGDAAALVQLHNKLIKPVKQHLSTRLIGIIPHGVLHYLPFAALNDGRRYFQDDHILFYLPSASAIPFIKKNRKSGGSRILAVAQRQAAGLPDLRYANTEAIAVADLYKEKALVDATESAFRAGASKYDILHLAAHAEFDSGSPLFSRIRLASDGEQDGALQVLEIYDLKLERADLVVLSACNTQLGGRSRGDDLIGLNRAFIYAGAPTVVASLWAVNDEATSKLMKSFYTHLRGGMSKAAALHAAQCEARQEHPHNLRNWAAFVLVGDPGASVVNPSCPPVKNMR